MLRWLLPALLLLPAACATTAPQHGTMSAASAAVEGDKLCEHGVPERVCTRHHPELAEGFKKSGDWCGEHGVPESQCLVCHPDLKFTPLPKLKDGADLAWLTKSGEDVALEPVGGKVTVFDFYADWCGPCREVDEHVFGLLNARDDLAYRKLNVVGWDSPLAKKYMGQVEKLPYTVVYGRDGKQVAAITGLDLDALDKAIAAGAAR